MNLLETFSFGQMLAHLRKRVNQPGKTIAALFDRSSPNWLSQWENNARGRPSLDLVEQFGMAFGLDRNSADENAILLSYLLRSADYPASREEVDDLRVRVDRLLAKLADPACVLDFHYRFVTSNTVFAQLFDGAASPLADTLELPAASRGVAQAPGIAGITGISAGSAQQKGMLVPGERQDLGLTLTAGQPFLRLLFSRQSRLRAEVKYDQWKRLAHYFVVRFCLTVAPHIRPGWYENCEPGHEGEPPWLQDLLQMLESLPDQAGYEFHREFEAIQDQIRDNPAGVWADLTAEEMPDTAIYWHGPRTELMVHTQELMDGRFTLYHFTPIEGTHIT